MRSKEQIAVLHDLFSQINERLDIIGETSDAYFLCQCVEILKQQGATIDAQATRITELEAAKKDAERYQCQPIDIDNNGVLRFRENKIVTYLLDFSTTKGCGMNELARQDFSDEDRMQFAQLIGYSLSGYGTLSYVTDAAYESACHNKPSAIAEGKQA